MRCLARLLVFLAVLACPANATTHMVSPDGTGDYPTIQAAISAAADGDTIALQDGTFAGDGNRDVDFFGKGILVRSQSGDPSSCVIDCDGGPGAAHRGFVFSSGEGSSSVLTGLSIVHGYAETGGAIVCDQASPSIENCWLLDNEAVKGGALFLSTANPVVAGCVFRDNYATDRGGAVSSMVYGSNPTFCDCWFESNRCAVGGGGAVQIKYSEGLFERCTFLNNIAGDSGGGVCMGMDGPGPEIRDCVFDSNWASGRHGGGLWFHEAGGLVERCIFVNNWAVLDGGGLICLDGSDTVVRNCTFYANGGDRYGGNIAIWDGASPSFFNCIIVEAPVNGGVFVSNASASFDCCDTWGNIGGNYNGIADPTGQNGNISEDPLLCDVANDDFEIQANSPCAPFTLPNPECDLIGACPIGCGALVYPDGSGTYPTIQAAIDAVDDADVVLLADGTFTGDGNRDVDFLGKEITVRSWNGQPEACIIDCQGTPADPHRGFLFCSGENNETKLEGLTILNGYAPANQPDGGGIFCENASPMIVNCIMISNTAQQGGGAACADLSAPVFDHCIFADNNAEYGGGLNCDYSVARLWNCTFSGNAASGSADAGGGVECWNLGEAQLENCIVAFSAHGRAIRCHDTAQSTLICSDIYGNEGGDWIGFIADQSGADGNFSADPCFCDPDNGDFHLWNYSPCSQHGCGLVGALPVACWDVQAIDEPPGNEVPERRFSLGPIMPNPCHSTATIRYEVPASFDYPVRITVHDATGRMVRTLIGSIQGQVHGAISWDGLDDAGRSVPTGIYHCRLRAGQEELTRPVVVVR